MGITLSHFIGAALTIALMVVLGILSGRWIKNSSDFSTGGKKAGATLVMGTIAGTLVGGSSTIGTAQLAFTFGLSAWWFTLGGGIACLVLGLAFVKPFRASGCNTVQEIIGKEYGAAAGVITAVSGTLGMLLNMIPQLLSFNALVLSIIPINPIIVTLAGIALMMCYVLFGGLLSTGVLGIAKMGLLYFAVMMGGILALNLSGGLGVLYNTLPAQQYFNLFARGAGIDAGAGFSLILGVLCTQTYMQAVLSAKTDKSARLGALYSAIIIPPIGAGGILIGQYMRIAHPYMNPALAFPTFVIDHFPPLLGGVALASLLIAVTGTGAGLALGFASTMTNNIYLRFINKNASGKQTLIVMRALILSALGLAVLVAVANLGSIILAWGFLSMALRGAVLFIPMCAALVLRRRVGPGCIIASSLIGLATVIAGSFMISGLDPLFLGVGASAATVAAGVLVKQIKEKQGAM